VTTDIPNTSREISPEELVNKAAPPEDGHRRAPTPERALRCLITNDDGIGSEGIRTLALMALEAGLNVTVAGPLEDVSGASASITAVDDGGHFVVERRSLPGLEECEVFGVGGLPAFIALTGARGAFGPPPDIVLSGINNGPNTGYAVLHSGTVGAALTGSTHGCRAMAVSIGAGAVTSGDTPGPPGPHWETAAEVARRALPWLIAAPAGTVLNVNAPNLPLSELKGFHRATLARFGAVQTNIAEKGEGYVKISVSEIDAEYEPGTDAALLVAGYATVTPLRPVCEASEVELPDFAEAGSTGSSSEGGRIPARAG
jgi:5'-nucleotidase